MFASAQKSANPQFWLANFWSSGVLNCRDGQEPLVTDLGGRAPELQDVWNLLGQMARCIYTTNP